MEGRTHRCKTWTATTPPTAHGSTRPSQAPMRREFQVLHLVHECNVIIPETCTWYRSPQTGTRIRDTKQQQVTTTPAGRQRRMGGSEPLRPRDASVTLHRFTLVNRSPGNNAQPPSSFQARTVHEPAARLTCSSRFAPVPSPRDPPHTTLPPQNPHTTLPSQGPHTTPSPRGPPHTALARQGPLPTQSPPPRSDQSQNTTQRTPGRSGVGQC